MKKRRMKSLALVTGAALIFGSVGCKQTQKTAGQEKTERPLVIGCGDMGEEYSPFTDGVRNNPEAVDMTQLYLMTIDRMGNLIKHGIDGVRNNPEAVDMTQLYL
ncbi:MAG: hypothetical protein E7277_01030, partial [Lachnospiraceae bacterium]|nr:hypothetical protein [Lachnospiraceae bacterium]